MWKDGPPRVKVCCIADVAEARLAVRLGASAVGLVSAMPSGPGVIHSEDEIAKIAAAVPPPVATFLLTSKTDAEQIIAQQKRCGTNTIQLTDRLETGTYAQMRQAMPGVALVQVIHVTGDEAIDEAVAVTGEVDAILLDSGRPNAAIKQLGGTGRTHDWRISRAIRDCVDVPVFLAGGLTPDNMARAIEAVEPFAVDVCSGVRTDGRLDEARLTAFMAGGRRSRVAS